jgi:hypothetical protein
MKPTQILYKIFVLFLACIFGGGAGFIALIIGKGIIADSNIPSPWNLIIIFGLIIASVATGVTLVYLICYNLFQESDKK